MCTCAVICSKTARQSDCGLPSRSRHKYGRTVFPLALGPRACRVSVFALWFGSGATGCFGIEDGKFVRVSLPVVLKGQLRMVYLRFYALAILGSKTRNG